MNYHKKTLEVLEHFGIGGKRASEIMKISYITFRMKKSEPNNINFFSEENYIKLIEFLTTETNKLKSTN